MIRFNQKQSKLMLALGLGLVVLSTNSVAKEVNTPKKSVKKVAVVKTATQKTAVSKATKTKVVLAARQTSKSPISGKVIKVSYSPTSAKTTFLNSGVASYYGPGFHGRRTANGETFNMHAMTAAHRTLPFGTKLKVTNLANGKSTIVRVNDRGPYVGGRIIDLSVAAAQQIGSTSSGVARVNLEVVKN